jgi:hypothetical protein
VREDLEGTAVRGIRFIAVLAMGLALAGCGFLGTGNTSHTKPNGFLLRGYVSVAGASPGAAGSSCQAPASASDIRAGGPVRVADPDGHTLATGALGAGVLAVEGASYRCNFPFEIPGVPGGPQRYVIGVGSQTASSFAADEVRRDKPAVVLVG